MQNGISLCMLVRYSKILILVTLAACILCCRKHSTPAPATTTFFKLHKVYLHDISSTYDRVYTITYTADDRVDSIILLYKKYTYVDPVDSDKNITTFSYYPDHYDVVIHYAPTYAAVPYRTVYTNADGTVKSIANRMSIDSTWFTYDAGHHLLNVSNYNNNGPYPQTTWYDYNWNASGNIDSYSYAGSAKGFYYYDMSRTGQVGDIFQLGNFLANGRAFPVTANVPLYYCFRNVSSVDTAVRYQYDYDTQGRITRQYYLLSYSPGYAPDTVSTVLEYY